MIKIYPSLISADLLNLETEIKKLEPYCDGFHLDIMDFHFVPNLTIGPDIINKVAKICSKQLFLHLMVDDPYKWLETLKLRKNDIFSFHFESTKNHKVLIEQIHKKNLLASIAINPETTFDLIIHFLKDVDQVLVMSVKPGFSGQQFLPNSFEKIKQISDYKNENNLVYSIASDGGINKENFLKLIELGVKDFAISSAIFNTENPINVLEELYQLAKH